MPVTAPVTMSKVVAEFGGNGRLSSYVRGGTLVPNTPANAAIATSAGGLRLSQFLGASAVQSSELASSINMYVSDQRPMGDIVNPSATAQYNSNGSRYTSTTQAPTQNAGLWLASGVASDFQVRASLSSGITPTGSSLNVWLELTSSPQWILTTTGTSRFSILGIEMRRKSTGVVERTGTVNLTVAKGQPL